MRKLYLFFRLSFHDRIWDFRYRHDLPTWFGLRNRIKRWFVAKWLQFYDLSMRPGGHRFLSVGKGDHKCEIYFDGSEEMERGVFEAVVPIRPGVWGDGWIHQDKMDGNRVITEGDKVVTFYRHGRVMWKLPNANP